VAVFFVREDGVFPETTPLEFPFGRRDLTGEEPAAQRSLLERTPRGRLLTGMAYGHLGLVAPPRDPAQMELLSRDDPKYD